VQQGLQWDHTLQGLVSPIYDLNDMLFMRTPEFHSYLQLLLEIGRGKLQGDHEYYNSGRNTF
jgi:hypothetical protein